MVKHDLDKLFDAKFIAQIKEATWLFPIVIILKKNEKLWVCVNFQKLNVTRVQSQPNEPKRALNRKKKKSKLDKYMYFSFKAMAIMTSYCFSFIWMLRNSKQKFI